MYKNLDSSPVTVEDVQLAIDYPKPKAEKKRDEATGTIRVLSLFSGCGGMDLGFEGGFDVHKACINFEANEDFIDQFTDANFVKLHRTQFETVFANDILDAAQTAWLHHFTTKRYHAPVFTKNSIVDIVKMQKAGIAILPSGVDVVTGGFPCQDFSVAGKRNGFNSHKDHNGDVIKDTNPASVETRGQLYMWMKEVIELTKPKMFVAENVKGLVNLSNVKDIIQQDFAATGDNGYIVLPPQVLNAAHYGVPQSRERVIFIGIRKSELTKKALKELTNPTIIDEYNPYPKPTHSHKVNAGLPPLVGVGSILAHLDEPERTTDLSQRYYSKAKYMGAHCQGQTEIKWNGLAPTIRAEHHGNIEYRRLAKERGGKLVNELAKGLAERRLTPRECALIQTFPPDYEFVIKKDNAKERFLVSPSAAYKIIGNAVPPLLAYHIAKRIEKVWDLYFK